MMHTHCHRCGAAYADTTTFPRKCDCGNMVWMNPIPVGVIVAECEDKLLIIERNIAPQGLALPGGFLEAGESWQAGTARELSEECKITIDPDDLTLINCVSIPNGNQILMFSHIEITREQFENAEVDGVETSAVFLMDPDEIECVFPLHTDMVRAFTDWKAMQEWKKGLCEQANLGRTFV